MSCHDVFPPITLQLLLLFMEIIRLLHPLVIYIAHVLSTPRFMAVYGDSNQKLLKDALCFYHVHGEDVSGVR